MLVLSRTTRELVGGRDAGFQRLRKFSLLPAEENRVEPGCEGRCGRYCRAVGDAGRNPPGGRSDNVVSRSDR
jgi:hypothetical protein